MSDPQANPATMIPEEVATPTLPPDVDFGLSLDAHTEPEPPVEPDAGAEHPGLGTLDRIEALAIQYGGDVMAEIRHLVAQVRTML
jgi:hypothetical protein